MPPLYAERNVIRLGEVNKLVNMQAAGMNPYRPTRNFTCDATVDEFHFFRTWNRTVESTVANFWTQGRYHLPRTSSEGRYISPRIQLKGAAVGRTPPPPAEAAAPVESSLPPRGPGTTGTSGKLARPRVLGVSWTWFGELNDPNPPYQPLLVDYGAANNGTVSYLRPVLEVSVEIDKRWSTPVEQEGYSPIVDMRGEAVEVEDPTNVRWSAQFRWAASLPAGAILLATPYLDDLSLYFDSGDSGFVNYFFN